MIGITADVELNGCSDASWPDPVIDSWTGCPIRPGSLIFDDLGIAKVVTT